MASWELPLPLGPELPLPSLAARTACDPACGTLLFLPDTMPVPSRDQLRDIGLDVQGARTQPHLADWIGVVRRTGNDTGMAKYSQMFMVQYCWAILLFRYRDRMRGNVSRTDAAIAEYMNCSDEAVRKYRKAIVGRLGTAPMF